MMHLEVGAVEICGQHGEGRRMARRKSRFQHCSDMRSLRWYTARRVCGDSDIVGSQQGLPGGVLRSPNVCLLSLTYHIIRVYFP